MSDRYTNVAKDNAHVGAQIGKAIGGVTIGSPHSGQGDLRGQLADLRSAMRRSVASGILEPELHEAIEAELAEVDAYLEGGGKRQRGKMVLALKKAKGLLDGFADLAAIAAALLAAGQGLG
jgi:hypothetical protein